LKRRDTELCKSIKGLKYFKEEQYICSDINKINFVIKLAINMAKKGNSLIFFRNVSYGKKIVEELEKYNELNNINTKIYYIDGGVKGEVRENIRKSLESVNTIYW